MCSRRVRSGSGSSNWESGDGKENLVTRLGRDVIPLWLIFSCLIQMLCQVFCGIVLAGSQAQLQTPLETEGCKGMVFLAEMHPSPLGQEATCFAVGFQLCLLSDEWQLLLLPVPASALLVPWQRLLCHTGWDGASLVPVARHTQLLLAQASKSLAWHVPAADGIIWGLVSMLG